MEHPVDGTQMSKASMIKGMLNGANKPMQQAHHSGLTIGTGLPIGAPVKTVGDVLALIQKYVGGGGGGNGPQGPSGPQGLQGPQGETGSMGPAGPAGPQGAQGISAYEVALINGFVGTEEEWLASLVGPQGEQGIQGEIGPAGADGADGVSVPAGGTTGQVLAKTSATDFDTEWIDPPSGGGGGGIPVSYFLDVRHSTGQLVAGTATTLIFGNKVEDTLSAYNTGTGVYVVPAELDGKVVQMTAATQFTTDGTASSELRIERSTNSGSSWDRVVQTGQDNTLFGLMNITTPVRLVTGQWYRVVANAGSSFTTVDNERSFFRIAGNTAVNVQPVDLSVYIAGMPEAEEVIHRAVLARELTLAGDMAGSYASVVTNPTTAAAAFLVKRNGSTVGQVVIGTSGTASFTTNGPGNPQVFAVGDILELVAPTTQNASMADISITLAFTREV